MAGGLVQIPVTVNRASRHSIQDQLADGIRKLITEEVIRSGMRLPATRALSRQLKISRNTVKNAYLNLISQGYLQSNGTSGTFVCDNIPDVAIDASTRFQTAELAKVNQTNQYEIVIPAKTGVLTNANGYDFGLHNTDPTITPERTWRRLLIKHLPYRSRHMSNLNPAGLEELREAVSNAVSPLRGMSMSAENSLIVSNDFRAFDIINRSMLRPGARVAIEDPCDAGLAYLLRNCAVGLVPIAVDQEGLIVDQLPMENVDLVYVSPMHQQPTGATMSHARRRQLIEWANYTGAHIVEWDTYGEFCYDGSPLPSIFSIDNNDRVIYINSFSSWLGADLELGYIAFPSSLRERILAVKSFLDPQASWLNQKATAEFVSSPSFFGHLRRVRQTFKRRRDTMIGAVEKYIGGQELSGQNAGRHLVWHLPKDFPPSRELQARAVSKGVVLPTLHDGYCRINTKNDDHDPDRTILLGYAAQSEEQVISGIAALAGVCPPSTKK